MSDHKIDLLLTALTLVLGRQLKAEKEKKNTWSTSDYVDDAARLIKSEQARILQLLR